MAEDRIRLEAVDVRIFTALVLQQKQAMREFAEAIKVLQERFAVQYKIDLEQYVLRQEPDGFYFVPKRQPDIEPKILKSNESE